MQKEERRKVLIELLKQVDGIKRKLKELLDEL
jgi:hypothetical protein